MHGAEKQPVERLVNDVQGRQRQQTGLDKCGEILEFPVTIGMALVGGLIGDANREEGNDGGKQVEPGVQRFG